MAEGIAQPIQISEMLIAQFYLPSITAYNRLEANPRTKDFDRSLKAEVRDALWMLTRQWQFGEFQGEDAATPVGARILTVQQQADRVVFPGDTVRDYSENMPIEARVERETLKSNLGLAVEISRNAWKMMSADLKAHRQKLIEHYTLSFSPEANDYDGTQLYEAATNRWWDGFKMYTDMITTSVIPGPTHFEEWVDGEVAFSATEKTAFKSMATLLVTWFNRMYSQPPSEAENAWKTSQLEYGFSLATPPAHQTILAADEYYQGHLDWYSFDLQSNRRVLKSGESVPPVTAPEAGTLSSFIPSPISFKGMPHPRFWQMEENQTDFGKIDTTPTGLLHLIFAEFGLIYANDWFMLPFPMQFNTLCETKGIVVTDVFGEETLVRPAGRGAETNWHRWVMYHNTDRTNAVSSTNKFYLASSLSHYLESEPVEKTNFLRDEMANMVWAVEHTVPSQAGNGISGDEMDIGEAGGSTFIPAGDATIRYVAGTTVPSNWIPFIPVHKVGSDTEIVLQRAKMPGSNGARGQILTEVPAPYFINEEEVPRAGTIVQRNWQRARWINGETFLWMARYKEAGKGEGLSDLKFDQIEDI
ncbi:MAG TPA: hypothetical protein VK826_00275 [Bacteroidia bacterium]|nr:hypothetical protein [Bacteroidia bacterium]